MNDTQLKSILKEKTVSLKKCIGLFLLALLIPSQVVFAQNAITVKGTLVDRTQEPLIGASVEVKGTSNGTVTNLDGEFVLDNVDPKATLLVSYIGYKPIEFPVNGRTSFGNIVMDENSQMLNEVVVEVGYNAVKRANILGSVASVNADDLAEIPVPSLSEALMDRMPGLNVGISSGSPLAQTSMTIRTSGTWNAEEPVYVIDGFIQDKSAFDMLDASQVESISILKDASAAVYGVRGAGGAVLVKTKMGQAGKMKVSYSADVSFSDATQFPEMMTAREHAQALNDQLWGSINWADPTTLEDLDTRVWFTEDELTAFDNLNYNWLDDTWKSSLSTRHNLSFSGGSERMRYFVSGSYTYQDGNFEKLNMNKYSTRLGLEVDVTDNLMAKVNMSASGKNDSRPYNQADGSEFDKMYFTYATSLRQPRWKPAYIDGLPVGNGVDNHPFEVFENGSYVKRDNRSNHMALELEYTVPWVKGLKASAAYNYQNNANHSKNIAKPYTLYNFATTGGLAEGKGHLYTNEIVDTKYVENNERLSENSSMSSNYQFNATLNYNNTFNELHDVFAVVTYEQAESNGKGLGITWNDLLIDNYELYQAFGRPAADGSIPMKDITNSLSSSARQAFVGRFNYGFDSRYLMEASFRYEASTVFAPGDRWGFFPSVAVGWRISEEGFFQDKVNPDIMNELKFRASYGRLGSDKANANAWNYAMSIVTGPYLGGTNVTTALRPDDSGLTSEGVTWEKTDSYNVGFDMNAFKHFSFTIEGFYKHSFDILQVRANSLSYTSGVTTEMPKENFGIQDAWGGEMALTYRNRIGADFKYSVGGYLSYATSEVIRKFVNPAVAGTWEDENGRIRGGDTGYFCEGIMRTPQQLQAYVDKYRKEGDSSFDMLGIIIPVDESGQVINPDEFLGMLVYSDVGGPGYSNDPDGKISSDDIRIISKYDSAPWRYGINLGFEWKGLRFSATLGGQFGYDVLYDKAVYTTGEGNRNRMSWLSEDSNNLAMWADHWTPDNPNASMPRLDSRGKTSERSTFYMVDGHTLTVRNASLSYVVPAKYYSKIGLGSLSVYLSGTNLWDIINPYPYKNASLSSWMDYPIMRTFNLGLKLTI